MSKKAKSQKEKPSKTKTEQKINPAPSRPEQAVVPDPSLVPTKPERVIRAIAVTRKILDAAKAYKRVTGISFYQLGHDAISERLMKEGYLHHPAEVKQPSQEVGGAKA
jgi:hypothetical protein